MMSGKRGGGGLSQKADKSCRKGDFVKSWCQPTIKFLWPKLWHWGPFSNGPQTHQKLTFSKVIFSPIFFCHIVKMDQILANNVICEQTLTQHMSVVFILSSVWSDGHVFDIDTVFFILNLCGSPCNQERHGKTSEWQRFHPAPIPSWCASQVLCLLVFIVKTLLSLFKKWLFQSKDYFIYPPKTITISLHRNTCIWS